MTKPEQPLLIERDAKSYQGGSAEGVIVRCRHCRALLERGDAVDIRSALPSDDCGSPWLCKGCAVAAGIGAD